MLKSFFKDKDGNYAILQAPNLPIILWAVFVFAQKFIDPPISNVLNVLAYATLFVWAYLEITDGDSDFRRLLGVAVVIAMVLGLIN